MEILEVADISGVLRQSNQLVKFHVWKVLGTGISKDTTSELSAEVEVVYWLVL